LGTFEAIYAEQYRNMFRVALKITGDREVAADIVQEVFINLFGRLQNGYEVHHPKSWLYRAIYNKYIDFVRKQVRFQNIESLRDSDLQVRLADEPDNRSIINLALSRLDPREKALAVLYSEGLTYREIAETTGIRFSSVGKMLSRTLKKLEKELKDQQYELY
jgi:RNA polymerase sigma-70 factor (ECF subfamily)